MQNDLCSFPISRCNRTIDDFDYRFQRVNPDRKVRVFFLFHRQMSTVSAFVDLRKFKIHNALCCAFPLCIEHLFDFYPLIRNNISTIRSALFLEFPLIPYLYHSPTYSGFGARALINRNRVLLFWNAWIRRNGGAVERIYRVSGP